MKKSLLSLLLAIFLLLSATACNMTPDNGEDNGDDGDGFTYIDLMTDESAGITVDGVKNEAVYDQIPYYEFGIRSGVRAFFTATKSGLYAFFQVLDNALFYDESEIYKGDCIEFYLDPDNKSSASPRKTTRQVQVACNGDYAIYKGSVTDTWELITEGNSSTLSNPRVNGYAVKTVALGTPSPKGVDAGIKNDTGYNAELFLSWESMEVDVKTVESNEFGESGVVGVAFGHRQVFSFDDTQDSYMNDVANATPNKYHKLKLVGNYKGVSTPTVDCEITVDGELNETVWENAVTVGPEVVTPLSGNATVNAKAFLGEKGLYIGICVSGDANLYAPITTIGDGVYKNDGCEIRIHTFDNQNGSIRSFKLLYDLYGMCWHDSPSGTPGACDELYKVKVNGTINDDTDNDSGWCMELFIPYYELQAESMHNGYLQGDRKVEYAHVMVAVQNFYITDQTNASDIKAQAPLVAVKDGVVWDSIETYPKVER